MYIGVINNCYSTGSITVNQTQKIGGILGNTIGNCYLENCFSTINIESKERYIGGILGYLDNTNYINRFLNNIYLGNLYSSYANDSTLNRIIANYSSGLANNYGYKDQLLNGYKNPNSKGASQLLTKDEVFNKYNAENIYNNIYSYKDLEQDSEENKYYLPKLKYSYSDELLPYQDKFIEIPDNVALEIKEVKTGQDETITVYLLNENDITITGIEVEDMEPITEFVNPPKKTNESKYQNQNVTEFTVKAKPIKYIDSYKITSIKYLNEENEEVKMPVQVKINLTCYKEISNVNDWQEIFGKNPNTNENYKITGDIDFAGIADPVANVKIGRLKGEIIKDTTTGDRNPVIKNLSESFSVAYAGLISNLSKELINIDFENITISNTKNYTGIIANCSAEKIQNINFKNIKIFANSATYVGTIGRNTCREIENITLENIYCNGTSQVGGFIGSTYSGNIKEVIANNVYINWYTDKNLDKLLGNKTSGSYLGGVFGYMSWNGSPRRYQRPNY